MIAGPNVFIYQDRVVICTEAFKDESDDPTIRRSDDPTIRRSTGATGVIDPLR
jgi:hypothetical protein